MQFYFEGKYEVSKRQWDAVMGGQCMDGDALPALSLRRAPRRRGFMA